MKFSQAYRIHGPDVMAIASALEIEPPEADAMINDHMNKLHERLARLRERHRHIRRELRQTEAMA